MPNKNNDKENNDTSSSSSVPNGPYITKKGNIWVAEDAQGNEIGRSANLDTLKRFLELS